MAAEAAANPIPNADLRLILLIAFLLSLRQRAAAETARALSSDDESYCETEKGGGLLGVRACRWQQCCSFDPDGDFDTCRFNGDYILGDLTILGDRTRLRSRVLHNVAP
jgi:hypothetical protein